MSAASPARSTERIVSLLWVLLAGGRRGVTRDYLVKAVDAYALSTSPAALEKMFTRDKEVLRGIGVPLEAFTVQDETGFESSDPVADTRYRIDEDRMYLPTVPFSNGERLALMRAESAWAGSDLGHAVVRALGRVDAGEDWLDTRSASDHEAFGVRLAGADRYLTELGDVVRDQAVIRFSYRKVHADRPEVRTVRAWALTNPTGVWYLVGWDLDRGEQRTFRLTRIESDPVVVTGSRGIGPAPSRPADLDLAAVRAAVSGERTPASTRLRLAAGRAVQLRLGAEVLASEPDADLVRVTYTRPAEMAGSIAAAGPLATVPDADDPLHAAVVALLDAALAAHAAPAPDVTLTAPRRRRNRRSDRDRVAAVVDAIGLANRRDGIGRAELAERLNVRDGELDALLNELWFCGMPERQFAGQQFEVHEQGGRIRITQAERLSGPLRLSVPEAAALVIGLRAAAGIPGLTDQERRDTDSALHKILEASGPEVHQAGEGIVAGFDVGPHAALAGRLHAAVRERRLVRFRYHAAATDESTQRTVEPLRLTAESGHGYLQAWCRTSDGLRNFRLDRIDALEETGEGFEPREAPPSDHLFRSRGDETTVTVHFAHRIRDLVPGFDPARTATLEDGSVVAEIRLARPDYAHAQAARFGGEFRVLAPQHLAESTVDWLRRARAGYVTDCSSPRDGTTARRPDGVA
ncbi:WYL domain-containing protein [Citricoccus nitrophenolicus]|uniref:WYL domain-containing protein n=1 Tax=Citricoccus nitrophenolicus TaxID=863575 RepID=A0ABV0ID95_9MICC|nr:WYL domain-containing protein [Citricoccus sp. I39-566]WMY77373.1 WYL domain-containing protein [Citricoccus sp. I39-566]